MEIENVGGIIKNLLRCYAVSFYDGDVLLFGKCIEFGGLKNIKYLVSEIFKVWRVSVINIRIERLLA